MMLISDSTIAGNQALGPGGFYGGIYGLDGTLEIVNSTISGNLATFQAGGVFTDSATAATLSHVTFSGNSSALGSGTGSFAATATLIASSVGANCLPGISISGSDNLADDASCGSIPDTLTGLDGTLADHGGPGHTHALLAGSNAIGHAGDCLVESDQRHAPRVGACDAGSFEYLGCPELLLLFDQTFTVETYAECSILASEFSTRAPNGDLTLMFGKSARFSQNFWVENGAKLKVEHEPTLELVLSEVIAKERRRRALDGRPPASRNAARVAQPARPAPIPATPPR